MKKIYIFLLLIMSTLICVGQTFNARAIIDQINEENKTSFVFNNIDFRYELEEFDIPEFPIQVDGKPYDYPNVKYYKAKGKNALISVYNDKEIFITEFKDSDIIRAQPYGNTYKTFEGPIGTFDEIWCDVLDIPGSSEGRSFPSEQAPGDVGTCILIDYIIDQSAYYTFGNLDTTIQYITELSAISTLLYANEGIDKRPSFMKFFTTENEWFSTSLQSSYDGLYALQDYVRAFGISGNSAHLIHMQPGIGGVAYLGGWNPNANLVNKTAFSSITDIYNDISQYSWTTMVWSHEEGHNAGAYHTHNCDNWGVDSLGNGVAYDKASAYNEGSCVLVDRCPNGHSTIMSYGHLSGGTCPVQMYFADGPVTNVNGYYERLPGDVIRTARDRWGFVCVEGCDGPGVVTTNNITATTATVNWTGDPNAEYIVYLNEESPVTVIGNSINVTGLLPNTYNCVNIQQVCNDTIYSIVVINCFETPCDIIIEGNHIDDMSEDLWSKQGWIYNPEGFYELPEDSIFNSNGTLNQIADYEFNRTMTLGSYCFKSTGEFAIIKTMIGGGSEPNWDAMKLEINSGTSWEQIGTYPDFYNDDDTYRYDPGWSGIFPTGMLQWDISPYVEPGTEFRFRFTFFSDVYNAQNGGPEVRYFEVQYGGVGECDSTVYDTTYVEVEVFDTTYITEYDTVTVEVFDTNYVTISVYDTVTVVVPVYDTTYVYVDTCVVEPPPVDCPCKGNKFKVCRDGITICVSSGQYDPSTMTLGPCEGQPCPNSKITLEEFKVIRVYPNPTSGILNIDYEGDIKGVNIHIIDGYGRVLYHKPFTSKVDITSFSDGLYTLWFNKDNMFIDFCNVAIQR